MSDACCGGACAPRRTCCGYRAGAVASTPAPTRRMAPSLVVALSGLLMLAGIGCRSRAATRCRSVALFLGSIALSIPTPARRAMRSLRNARARYQRPDDHRGHRRGRSLATGSKRRPSSGCSASRNGSKAHSMERARRAIRRLMTLAPAMALVRRGDDEHEMPVDEVRRRRPGHRASRRAGAGRWAGACMATRRSIRVR